MHLAQLEIFGFKSFGRRIKVDFHKGVSAVVGPNGTGKTNVIDAIRWVIGERRIKMLRGGSLEDVIFSGTSTKNALNMAEVTITFSDCRGQLDFDPDADTLTITRRAFRDGNSEFIMNGLPVRMKDIRQTLLSLGISSGVYSIIELPMMKQIIDEDPDSRRMLFEEAADILKFKTDRISAENKLDSALTDMDRIEDIYNEVSKNVDRLRKQASKANRYSSIRASIADIKRKINESKFASLSNNINDITAEIDKMIEQETSLRNERSTSQTDETKIREKQREVRKHREEAANKLNQITRKIGELDKEIAVWNEKKNQAENLIKNTYTIIDNSKKKIEEYDEELEYQTEELEKLENQLPEIESRSGKLEKELSELIDNLVTQRNKRNEFIQSKQKFENDVWRLKQSRKQLENEYDSKEGNINRLQSEIQKLNSEFDETKQQLTQLESDKDKSDTEYKELESRSEDIQGEYETLQNKYDESREQLISYQGKLSRLDGEIEGLEIITDTARKELSKYPERFPIRGVVADFFEPDSDESSRTLELHLGNKAGFMVVDSAETAEESLKYLYEKKLGTAGFFILDELAMLDFEIEGNLQEQVNCLEDDMIVLLHKANIGKMESTYDKYYAESDIFIASKGYRYGGFADKGILSRSMKLRKLKSRKQSLVDSIEVISKERDGYAARLKGVKSEHEEIILKKKLIEKRQANDNMQIARLETKVKSFESELLRRKDILDKTNISLLKLSEEIQKIVISDDSNTEFDKEINDLNISISDHEKNRNELQKKIQDIQLEKVRITETKKRHELDIKRLELSIKEQRELIEKSKKSEIEAKETESKAKILLRELSEQLNEVFESRKEIQDEISEVSNNEQNLQREIEKLITRTKNIQIELDKLENVLNEKRTNKARFETSIEKLMEENPFLESLHLEKVEIISPDEMREFSAELAEFESKMERIGPVNFEAEIEYENEKDRYEFLKSQRDDVNQSVKLLKQTINKLNKEAETMFISTFEQARDNFRRIFQELFQGGDADIELINKDGTKENINVLEADIQIMTRPAGKKRLNITQLSQGEKALVAISLLFGLYLVRPSPICMLDEVDAPLDEANVGRFIDIVRRFETNTQFVLITHNKKTMQSVDYIYGLTMDEGVSKIISLRMDEITEENAGIH